MNGTRISFFIGTLVGAAAMGIVLTGAGMAGYTSKIVFENDRVRVKDVTFPPGVLDTGMHTHDLPHVGVILDQGALVFTEPGKATETVKFSAGSVGYRDANVTHQVANPGGKPMRVIEVELK
jgi:mannose-6-phosphate isomerase-like protein (cupin superfamily)